MILVFYDTEIKRSRNPELAWLHRDWWLVGYPCCLVFFFEKSRAGCLREECVQQLLGALGHLGRCFSAAAVNVLAKFLPGISKSVRPTEF